MIFFIFFSSSSDLQTQFVDPCGGIIVNSVYGPISSGILFIYHVAIAPTATPSL